MFTQVTWLKTSLSHRYYLPPLAKRPGALRLLVPPEPLPEPSRVRGFGLMSTDIASHRHARRRFGMRRDALSWPFLKSL